MTADSTISFSHFHGARSVPSTTGACSSSIAATPLAAFDDGSSSSGKSGSSAGGSIPVNPENRSSAGGGIDGGVAADAASGTWESERYSANRAAERRSTAHPSSARNARPDGWGRPVPRSNHAGIPARENAWPMRPT